MEKISKRGTDKLLPCVSIPNLPEWLRLANIGDKITLLKAEQFAALGVSDEIIERLANKTLTLSEPFIRYMEMSMGEHFGTMTLKDGTTTPCLVSWIVEKPIPKGMNVPEPWSIVGAKPTKKQLDDMISKVDKVRLTSVLRYANSGRQVSEEVVNKYLDLWSKAKFDLYRMLGDKLIISRDIEYEMDNTEMSSLVVDICKRFPKYASVLTNFETHRFVNNTCGDFNFPWMDRISYPRPSSSMKLSKWFSELFQDELFDIEFSKLLQNSKVKGHFHVSIDPYDLLTISTNQHGWTSCVDIKGARNGGHANGAFSYFFDATTMVAYRSNDKDYEYSIKSVKFTGNSKSWRQLVHINKSNCALMFNREYPQSSSLKTSNEARMLIQDQIAKFLGKESIWENLGNDDRYYKPQVRIAYNDSHNERRVVTVPEGLPLDGLVIDSGANIVCLDCGEVSEQAICRKCSSK